MSPEELIKLSSHAVQPFRVRDVRKFASTAHLSIDNTGLRGMLAIPIRWHRISIGTILAFGKKNEVFFNENDQSLAELLSIQAAGAFESAWLQQESPSCEALPCFTVPAPGIQPTQAPRWHGKHSQTPTKLLHRVVLLAIKKGILSLS